MRDRARIALIDDERDALELSTRALVCLSIEVVPFLDPEAALAYLRDAPIDLVVTDLRMPRLDGRAFIREFRESAPSTPIVVTSSEPVRYEEVLAFGANAFVPKSSPAGELPKVVSELLSDRPIAVSGLPFRR